MMFHEVTFIAEEIHVWAKKGAFGSSSGSLPLRVANRGPSKGRRCLYYVRSSDKGLRIKTVATTRRAANQSPPFAQSLRDIVAESSAPVSIIPIENEASVARISSPVDCHCWQEYRQSFVNAISKIAPEATNRLATVVLCQLRCHHEHDDDTSKLVDQWMAQIRIASMTIPTAARNIMDRVLTLLRPA